MRNRIQLPDTMYLAQFFFNSLTERDFLHALDSFVQGNGFSIDGAICSFPLNLSEDLGGSEDQYGYIEFWTYSANEETIVSFLDFMKILTAAADSEIRYDPKMEMPIKDKISTIEKKIKEMEERHRKATGAIS